MASLHHLALGAHDLRSLGNFYCSVFGLSEVAVHHREDGTLRSLWLSLGSGVLMIEKSAQELRRVEGVGSGIFLIAFQVNEAERAQLETRLAAHGAPIEERSEFTTYTRDPEGNRIAISSYPVPQVS